MSNPFTKFAASKTLESSGWLSVKKRGRDDDAIARDSKAAVEQRKKTRNKNTSSKKKTTFGAKKELKNRKVKQITLDSNDDNDSFIASESEEESIHFSEEEEEEEELEFDEAEEEADDDDEISFKDSDDEDDEIIEVDSSPEKPRQMKSVKLNKAKQVIVLDSSNSDIDMMPSAQKRESTGASKSKFFDTDIS